MKNNILLKSLFFLMLTGIILLTTLVDLSRANSQSDNDDINSLVSNVFPRCRLMNLDDLYDDYTRSFIQKKHSKINPFFLRGDFDGNGLNDFACLLFCKDNGKSFLFFRIATQKSPGNYVEEYSLDLRNYIDVFIIPANKGTKVKESAAFDTPLKEHQLENSAITLVSRQH
jgi:hypothetical protein